MLLYYLMTFTEALLGVVGIRGLYEQPRYTVERHLPGGIEIRDYAARVAAETADDGSGSAAFQRLFGYITGANATGARIAMTAPVATPGAKPGRRIAMTVPVQTSPAGGTMRFFLPRRVAEAGAPVPRDPRVTIVTVPAERIATLRFSGLPTRARTEPRQAALLAALARAGIATDGAPYLLTYDAPFTLPFLRRNEAAVRLR